MKEAGKRKCEPVEANDTVRLALKQKTLKKRQTRHSTQNYTK